MPFTKRGKTFWLEHERDKLRDMFQRQLVLSSEVSTAVAAEDAAAVTCCSCLCPPSSSSKVLVLRCCGPPSQAFCEECTVNAFKGGLRCPRGACSKIVEPLEVLGVLQSSSPCPCPSPPAQWVQEKLALAQRQQRREAGRFSVLKMFDCPVASCSGQIIHLTPPSSSSSSSSSPARMQQTAMCCCSKCDTAVCTICRKDLAQHGPQSCIDGAAADHARLVSEALAISPDSKRCPSCDDVVVLQDGCNTVKCARCRAYFCWLCGFVTENGGSTAAHAHYQTPGTPCQGLLFGGRSEYERRNGGRPWYTGWE